MSEPVARPLTFRHLSALETLARDREAFHPRDALLGTGRSTLADLAERGFVDVESCRRGWPARYRITAEGLAWIGEAWDARRNLQNLRNRREIEPGRHPVLDAITAAVHRLAAERGLPVEEVERRAGLKAGALAPENGGKLRVVALAAVATVLKVQPRRLFPE